MSRTRHGAKGPGYEYWASRPHSGEGLGKATKVATHKTERRLARYRLHLDQIRCEHEPIDEVDEMADLVTADERCWGMGWL